MIDGDTIDIEGGYRVRYIGIDTPEKDEAFYSEAKEANRRLVEGKTVWLTVDAQPSDRYGRLLAYVWAGERLVNRIVFPEIRRDGVYYLSGRATLPGQEHKYLGLPLPKPLYGLQALGKSKIAFLTEGYFDWLTLLSWGYPALCLGGTRLKSQHVALLAGLARIHLALDSDQAGGEGAAKIQEALGERAVILRLPAGVKDVNELATSCQEGRNIFGRLVNGT